jgi:hypothetical protein
VKNKKIDVINLSNVILKKYNTNVFLLKEITAINKLILLIVQSRAINFGRQGHSLTQSKMLHCKTVLKIITYHHVVRH